MDPLNKNMANPTQRTAELDVFRWIAVVLMVINHGGIALMTPQVQRSPVGSSLLFIGSLAPTLFFFATGWGVGLQQGTKADKNGLWKVAYKVGALLLADQVAFWARGQPVGLDFLGFIAVAYLLLSLIVLSDSPRAISLVAIAVILVVRYAVPYLTKGRLGEGWDWLPVVVGATALKNMSYPLAPWLVFPLLGFLFGSAPSTGKNDERGINVFLMAITILSSSGALWMADRGIGFFRWGIMSIAFLVLSIAILGLALLVLRNLASLNLVDSVASFISIRGIASLAVVPIHYAIVSLVGNAILPAETVAQFMLIVIPGIALTIWLSKRFESWVEVNQKNILIRSKVVALLIVLCLSILSIIFGMQNSDIARYFQWSAQLAICYCLLFKVGARQKYRPAIPV